MADASGIDFEKTSAELVILRGFIDFVNAQIGVYMDCLSGFQGNTVRIERQVARVLRPTGRGIKDGRPTIMSTSFEDPSSPDVIHHRIISVKEFLSANRDAGFNHQQICWSIIIFLFAYWDEEIRPQIAEVRGVKPSDIKIDALGDLRTLRKCIIHNKGIISATEHAKLRKMNGLVSPGDRIAISHDHMHKIFVLVKQAIAEIVLTYTGLLPGAPKASDLVDLAIQNARGREES